MTDSYINRIPRNVVNVLKRNWNFRSASTTVSRVNIVSPGAGTHGVGGDWMTRLEAAQHGEDRRYRGCVLQLHREGSGRFDK